MRALIVTVALALAVPAYGQPVELVPSKRLEFSRDTDLPGGDIGTFLDTSLDACEKACLTNDRCDALTYNSRKRACFIKAGPGEATGFAGAFSAKVLRASAGADALATANLAELTFISPSEMSDVLRQAELMGRIHMTDGQSVEELRLGLKTAEAKGDFRQAAQLAGALATVTDSGADWADYARLMLTASPYVGNERGNYLGRAVNAAVNAYLREPSAPARHSVLLTLARAYEEIGRGQDTVQALRLAQSLQARDDTDTLLDEAIAKYGFRIVETQVQADLMRPRICATFSEDLATSGVDYEVFVQLPEPGMTVSSDGWRNLCVEGLTHGQRYAITFRDGLPAANGQTTVKPVTITQFVRDRVAGARFPGRSYVLPRSADAALPVETVNTTKLDLTLYRIDDRNLTRAFQNDYFGEPMRYWQEEYFSGEIASEIWTGHATVGMEINHDVTTRLPLGEALKGQPVGVYALKATVPGEEPDVSAPAWQWFVVSDLGLTTLSGVDGLHVFVRSLGTAEAVKGVQIDLVSTANEVLATTTTDDKGYARFDPGLAQGKGGKSPALVVARGEGEDLAFLSLTDPEFDLSDRGVSGREAAKPIDLFVASDRGAYRAGETIHVTALARDADLAAIAGLPITAVLKRPDGVEYSRQLSQDAGAGGHVFALPVAGSAPRGVWSIDFFADTNAAALATKTVLVEDFLPERIDFTLDPEVEAVSLTDTPSIAVDAKFLFGAPGADLAVEGEVLVRAAKEMPGFAGYVFGPSKDPFPAQTETFGGDRTGEDGSVVVYPYLPQIETQDRPLEARFTVRVSEGSGRPVERQITLPITPAGNLIGVKPLFDGVAAEGRDAAFEVIAVSPKGQRVEMPVTWKLTQNQTTYQWYQSYGDWSWEAISSRKIVAEGEATLGQDRVEILAPVDWGNYELTVTGGDAVTSYVFDAGWYAPADVTATPDTLEVSLDKPAYASGETAKLRVVPRTDGKALITVVSNRLIAMQSVDVVKGENVIDIPVTDAWSAGVYVTATVIQPMDEPTGRNPTRALGLAHALTAPGKRQLDTLVEVAPTADPRAPLDVAVKVGNIADGDVAYVTLAAVDQGILNLTGTKAPDPSDYYFGKRKLGIGIRDLYGRLINGMNGEMGAVRSGGDASAQARLQSPPPTEELVAYFTGPIPVGADGYARTSFDLPSFNGTVKVMAIAWSATAVGQANADVLVRDPVVVTASLPRFLAPGDQSRLLLEIVHAEGPTGTMALSVTGDNLTLGELPASIDLGQGQKQVISLAVQAQSAGLHHIDIALTTPDGKVVTKTLALPVEANDPELARTSRLTLDAGQTLTFDNAAFTGLDPATAKAVLAIGPISRLNAPGLLAALDAYPYGCTEQVTSKALPLLYFDEVAKVMDLPGATDLGKRIDQSIAVVLGNQSSEGAFGLWGPSSGDLWLDAFVTDFLSRAKARGHQVPDQAFRRALDNLRNQVNYAPDFTGGANGGGRDLAYALMVLAREGAAAIGDLRYYADVKADDFSSALAQAQLGAALASYGDQQRADALFAKAVARVSGLLEDEGSRIYRADYGSNYRDAAALLTLAVEAGTNVVDREALADRLARPIDSLSTQEATWGLMAANALIDRPQTDGLMINGATPTGPLVKVLSSGQDPVVVFNGSQSPTQITLTTFGVPTEAEPAGGNGYAIKRKYYTLTGEAVDRETFTVGERLVTVIEVQPFSRTDARLMIDDALPAGFEIDNPRLLTSGAVSDLDWLNLMEDTAHAEFRQDRFLSAVDQRGSDPFRLAYIVRAVSPGTFHQPAASVVDMYNPAYRARTDSRTITIAE